MDTDRKDPIRLRPSATAGQVGFFANLSETNQLIGEEKIRGSRVIIFRQSFNDLRPPIFHIST
jgi:hypothetical protein